MEKGAQQLVALSTRPLIIFSQKAGYLETTPDILPPERRKKYEARARKFEGDGQSSGQSS